MANNQEKIQEALTRIDTALENINTDADWLAYLTFQSRFYNYSAGNILLIYAQKPQASFVKGYKAWNQLGRYVKKGAKGICILAPCIKKIEEFAEPNNKAEYTRQEGEKVVYKKLVGFKTTYVFDIADTDGSDEHIPVLVRGLSGNSEEERQLYEKLKSVISTEHQVSEVTGTASKGSFNLETGDIHVRSDLEYLQKIKTILHEYGHAVDFKLHPDETIHRNRRELIAESVAYVVASRLGLDTSRYTMGYLKSWMTDKDELKIVADAVQKVSAAIIKKLAESSDSAFSILTENNKEDSDNG